MQKSIMRNIFIALLWAITYFPILADVTKTVGTTGADFTTLKLAFDAINANTGGVYSGAITLQIIDNTTETATAAINNTNTNWTSINIYPTISGKTLSGNIDAPLIDFNGVDNVTLDGRLNQSGAIDLTIKNTSTSATATTSTIRFINDASFNTVQYCTIQGATTDATAGIVFFSTALAGGNDNNTVSFNNITNATDTNRPLNAICSEGSVSPNDNSNNTISNNAIYNFLNRSAISKGIFLSSGTTACAVNNNSFYETASFVPTASVAYKIIDINNSSGSNFEVSGNYLGGSSAFCGSGGAVSSWTKTNAFNNSFVAIDINVGNAATTNIQTNTITNFTWGNSGAGNWTGINITAGEVSVGNINSGNTLGSNTSTGAISFTAGATGATFIGINIASTNTVICQNSIIGSITASNAATLATNVYGICKTATAGTATIKNNIVGSATIANSILASSAATANIQRVYGIYSAGTGSVTISGNVIGNITNATTNTSSTSGATAITRGIITLDGSNDILLNRVHNIKTSNAQSSNYPDASLIGISQGSETAATTQNVIGNTVYNLENTAITAIELYGIFYKGPTTGTHTIARNFVHSFIVVTTDAAYLHGISLHSGTYTASNNIVFLGNNINVGCQIWGIWNNSNSAVNIYHNTSYIAGTATTGTKITLPFRDISTAPTARNIRNNIFWNARTNNPAGVISHYAIYLANTGNTTLDYNDYQYAEQFGVWGGATKATFAIWKSDTGQDANSLNTNPAIINLGGTNAVDYKIGAALNGVSGTGITTDYDMNSRGATPSMGAWEFNINKWKGTNSNDWNTATNWTQGVVPAVDANIVFDDAPTNHCQLDQNRSVTDIVNAQGTYRMVNSGNKLTVKGDFIFSNGANVDASATSSTVEFAGSTAQNIPAATFLNNDVYNLTINNINNVTLSGSLNLLNTLTATTGQLDAYTNSPTFSYAGTTAQSITGTPFYLNKIYNLSINNSTGVTLDTDLSVSNALTINAGKLLTISPAKQMNVIGTIDNQAGTAGLVIKASNTLANGSLIFHNAVGSPVFATVEMYSKASYNLSNAAGSKFKWQYFGIPLRSVAASPTLNGAYIRALDETGTTTSNHWTSLNNGSTLTSFLGYEICQQNATTYTFTGTLENGDYSSGQMAYTNGALYSGQHLSANPYTAAIDITQLNFGSQTEAAVYLYNTGTFNEWNPTGGTTYSGTTTLAGQYTVSTPLTAGIGGVPGQVPSMQAFLVKAMSNDVNASLGINYNSVVVKNSEMQRVSKWRKAPDVDNKVFTRIDVVGKNFADKMWIFTDPSCKHTFDNGADGKKMIGDVNAPQLYAIEPDGDYQIDVVNDMNNTNIGFQTNEVSEYVLTFTHQNIDKHYQSIYLFDIVTNQIVDITSDKSSYKFTADQTTSHALRFKILTSTNAINNGSTQTQLFINSTNNSVYIDNRSSMVGKLKIFTPTGALVFSNSFGANTYVSFNTELTEGVYLVLAETASDKQFKKIVIVK